MSLDELKAKLAKAEENYRSCGCRVYKEEIRALTKAIQDIEGTARNQRSQYGNYSEEIKPL